MAVKQDPTVAHRSCALETPPAYMALSRSAPKRHGARSRRSGSPEGLENGGLACIAGRFIDRALEL